MSADESHCVTVNRCAPNSPPLFIKYIPVLWFITYCVECNQFSYNAFLVYARGVAPLRHTVGVLRDFTLLSHNGSELQRTESALCEPRSTQLVSQPRKRSSVARKARSAEGQLSEVGEAQALDGDAKRRNVRALNERSALVRSML
jgi:hypothetical protein